MNKSRIPVIILILAGLISGLGGIAGDVASGVLPETWRPYLWLAWPLFIVCTVAGIGLAIWQYRVEQRTQLQAETGEPEWVPKLAEAIRQAGQPEPSPPPPTTPLLHQLPADLADFTGRTDEIRELLTLLAEQQGDAARARELWEQTLRIFEEIEDPNAERVRDWLVESG